MGRPLREYSHEDVEQLVARGQKVFVVDGLLLKADTWLDFHPGGDKAILHMVGRDATDEVHALHSSEALQRMKKFRIGRVVGRWQNLLPPIQAGTPCVKVHRDQVPVQQCRVPGLGEAITSAYQYQGRKSRKCEGGPIEATPFVSPGKANGLPLVSSRDIAIERQIELDMERYPSLDSATQADIVSKYRALNDRIRQEGLYECNYSAYASEIARYLFLFCLSMLFLRLGWYGTSGAFLGLFWHQLVFTAHDAGHMGITHNFHIDTVIGIFVADFLGGLSLGWWKRNHNVHHIVTNAPEHDPDIEHMPFFAISPRFFGSLYSTYYERVMRFDWMAQIAIQSQQYLYYPLLTLGRFNLYVHSWTFLLLGLGPRKGPAWWHRWLELAGNIVFWTWYGYAILYRCIPTLSGRLLFVMVSHMITGPLHVQITLSHFAMSTADLGVNESFPQKMLRTTMDVDCPEWLDFFHGGLQFQAIHHLFPRIPRHNLRSTQRLVRDFCREVRIPYTIYGFAEGNKEVIGRLGEVGRQAAFLAACQKAAVAHVHPS